MSKPIDSKNCKAILSLALKANLLEYHDRKGSSVVSDINIYSADNLFSISSKGIPF
jgi:hypothetical protein